MTYTEPTNESVEHLLWLVHDECMNQLTSFREQTIHTDQKIDRLFLILADLSKALAGGYREGGLRE